MSKLSPEILCAGKTLKDFAAVRVDIRRSVQWIPEARVVMRRSHGTRTGWWKSCSEAAALCQPGVEVQVRFDGLEIFRGSVMEQTVQWSDQELQLWIKHPLQGLVNTLRSQVFEDQDDGQIFARIFKDHGVDSGPLELTNKHPQMIQWDCSDWQFIRSRLASHAVWLFPLRDKVICKAPALGTPLHVLRARRQESADIKVVDAQWFTSNEMQTRGVTLQYWDVNQQKLSTAVSGTGRSFASGALDPLKIKPLSPKLGLMKSAWMTSGEAQALVDGRQLAQDAAGVRVWLRVREERGEGKGILSYELGDTLELSGFGDFSGKGVISALEYQWLRGTWTGVVATGMPLPQAQDAAGLPRNTRMVLGIVQPYKKDARGLSRLLVKVPMLGVPQAIWARLASPYASKNAGLCFYPEAGDEVVLSFVDDDPRYPLIMGSLHNPRNLAPFEPSQDNAVKGFRQVQDGKEQSWLFDTKKNTFSVVNDKDKVVIDANGLYLDIQADFVVSAKKDLTAETGGSVKINAKKQATVESGQVLTLQSKQKLVAQGQAQVEIKGAKIDLKS